METERFMGQITWFDPTTKKMIIQVDFLLPEKQEIIEQIIQDKKTISFHFSKPFRRMKSYEQLKKYYSLITQVLTALEISPTSDIVKAFDEAHKMRCFPASCIQLGDQVLPIVKSKANMTIEEMDYMIQMLYETYGEVLSE